MRIQVRARARTHYTHARKARSRALPVTARHDVVPTHPRLNAVLTAGPVVFQVRAGGGGFRVSPPLEKKGVGDAVQIKRKRM